MNVLLGFVAGYLLGAKAGPESLEELRRAWNTILESEEFQGLVAMGSAYFEQALEDGGGQLAETLAKLGPLGATDALGQLASLAQSNGDAKAAFSRLAETPEVQAILVRGLSLVDGVLAQGSSLKGPS